ncbi:MAG: haloalkane dehalogenase [Gammaproteobacteria bacterium]
MDVYRTPENRFQGLAEFPWEPRYAEVEGLRMAWVEAGPPGGEPVLLLHGEPTWSYLYRKMIPVLAEAGLKAIAPDLVGFGRSDKPTRLEDYTYARHVAWTAGFLEVTGQDNLTLVCQDWGSLIGLRLAAEHPGLFSRIVVANGFLPTGDTSLPAVFRLWRAFARWTPVFPVSRIVASGCARPLSSEARRAYDAPFPTAASKAGARAFPRLVPAASDDPAVTANREAWNRLGRWQKPFLTLFGSRDPIFRGADRVLQAHVPGARGQAHGVLRRAGHFIQEDAGEALARRVADFVAATPRPLTGDG